MNSNQKPELTRIGKGKRQNFGSCILREERMLFIVEWALK